MLAGLVHRLQIPSQLCSIAPLHAAAPPEQRRQRSDLHYSRGTVAAQR